MLSFPDHQLLRVPTLNLYCTLGPQALQSVSWRDLPMVATVQRGIPWDFHGLPVLRESRVFSTTLFQSVAHVKLEVNGQSMSMCRLGVCVCRCVFTVILCNVNVNAT